MSCSSTGAKYKTVNHDMFCLNGVMEVELLPEELYFWWLGQKETWLIQFDNKTQKEWKTDVSPNFVIYTYIPLSQYPGLILNTLHKHIFKTQKLHYFWKNLSCMWQQEVNPFANMRK